jgi:hypothetical protein
MSFQGAANRGRDAIHGGVIGGAAGVFVGATLGLFDVVANDAGWGRLWRNSLGGGVAGGAAGAALGALL